jgi:hypothetical protein
MVNTNYHKSINKTLISRNYFDDFFSRLLLHNNNPEHTGFAIGILMSFRKRCGKYMEHLASYQQSYPPYSYGYTKSCVAIGTRCEPLDCDRSDYHR